MGISGLRPFLNKRFDVSTTVPLSSLAGRRMAVDVMCIMYSCLRSAGEDRFITCMVQNMTTFKRNNIEVVYVFDGKNVPEEKTREREKRRSENAVITEKIERAKQLLERLEGMKGMLRNAELVDEVRGVLGKQSEGLELRTVLTAVHALTDSVQKWEKQTIFVNDTHIAIVKKLCKLLNVAVYNAIGEGEGVCASLCVQGKVDYAFTEDTDVLAYGCPNQVYSLDVVLETVKITYLSCVLDNLEFSYEQFKDFCILLKCDYNGRVPGVGPSYAYDLISAYDSIDGILEDDDVPKKLARVTTLVREHHKILKYERCRELFTYKRLKDVKWRSVKNIDYDEVTSFLHSKGVFLKAGMILPGDVWHCTQIQFEI